MTRVLLHAGFHKTGTKTVQHFLRSNRPLLRDRAVLVLPARIRELTRLGFWYQDLPEPDMLDRMRDAYADFFRSLKRLPGRDLVISAENMLGRMPDGRSDCAYPVAGALLPAIIAALRSLPPPVEIVVYLSMRAQPGWVRSLYAHFAAKPEQPRLTEDFGRFAARFTHLSLEREADRIVNALPDCPVSVQNIETLSNARFGIAQPFVDFLDLPEGRLSQFSPVEHRHRSADPALVSELVALNRSDLDAEALAQAKRDLIRANADDKGEPQ